MLEAAEVAHPDTLLQTLQSFFANPKVDFVDAHNAKPGCFAARAKRTTHLHPTGTI